MTNVWADLAKMKRDFPIDAEVKVAADVVSIYWDAGYEEDVIVRVVGYSIEEGMIQVANSAGMEFSIYPEEGERYFPSQMC